MAESKNKLPPFLLKFLGSKSFKFNDGCIYLIDVMGMFLPMQLLVVFLKTLESKFDENKAKGLLYGLGEIQAYMGTSQMIKRFGFKSNKDTLLYSMQQSSMVGSGKSEAIKLDFNNNHFLLKLNPSPFAKECKSLYGIQKQPVDAFMRGCSSGMIKAITRRKDIFAVETQCVAMGKPYCVFDVRPEQDFDKSNPLIATQLQQKNIIDEKMTGKLKDLNNFLRGNF